ncbi:MAG: hypothetical protein HC923_10860, partial [Myxococcales bacterium]|nr:hypothetical protein [Myxococcales bacterium]
MKALRLVIGLVDRRAPEAEVTGVRLTKEADAGEEAKSRATSPVDPDPRSANGWGSRRCLARSRGWSGARGPRAANETDRSWDRSGRGPDGADADAIRDYAKTPRRIDDVALTYLAAADRRLLLQHAVILTFVDGEQTDQERHVLEGLIARL